MAEETGRVAAPAAGPGTWLRNGGNSSRPYTAARTNALGVLHKAEIVNPTKAARRVVNSALLAVGDADEIGPDRQHAFATTDRLSPKVYG